MTDVDYLSPRAAATFFTLDGQHASKSSVYRWMRYGLNRNGRRVRLGHVCIGTRLATTREFIQKFNEDLAAADALPTPAQSAPATSTPPSQRTPQEREAAASAASARLAASGV